MVARVIRVRVASVLVVAVLGAGLQGLGSGLLAQAGRRLAVVAESPDRLEAALNATGAQGYTCAGAGNQHVLVFVRERA
jgi:threonine dehydrogenase-like Zn-dependent dehydrogenase